MNDFKEEIKAGDSLKLELFVQFSKDVVIDIGELKSFLEDCIQDYVGEWK